MDIFLHISFILYFTFASLQHGGQIFQWQRWADNALWFFPFLVLSLFTAGDAWLGDNPSLLHIFGLFIVSSSVAALCAAGKTTGHGQYFSLGNVPWSLEPERVDVIVSLFWGPDPRLDVGKPYDQKTVYFRCITGLAVKGLLTGLAGAILVVLAGYVPSGLFIAIGGLLFPVGYAIGWLPKVRDTMARAGYDPNVLGEAVSGAIFGFFFSLAVQHMF